MRIRAFKLTLIAMAMWSCLALSWAAPAEDRRVASEKPATPPLPTGLFSPSTARTEDGGLIPEAQFFRAARCASCHKDTHAGWSESLHRNSGREPFYKESVDILLRARGIEFTRHCESCHAPVALLSGALTADSKESRALDDEGVTCSVCHSITEARLDGTGSYTIRRPALLAREDGTPIFGDVSDGQILGDVPGHRRAVMRPLLKSPEFCATCHKSSAPPELNGYKFIRGFSAYDEWQQSGASHETVTPFYRRPHRADCRSCHMPKVESANDMAAKGGLISLHRWPGANTAAPLFYGQTKQVELTEKFLQKNVLSLDIFAIKREASAEQIAPLMLQGENHIVLGVGEEVTAEVVVSNRNAAHSFPPELRDLYEAWVEFEVLEASGKRIFHSGYLKPDGTLDESAHVYRAILLDESGRMITRHQVWVATAKAYDNAVPPGRSDIVRFRFRLPASLKPSTTIKLRARLNYRRFNQEYIDYVLGRLNARLAVPVILMAEASAGIKPGAKEMRAEGGTDKAQYSRRWNDYGIGLVEQAQYGAAAEAFRRASELDPGDPNLLVNAAIAEMKTERYAPEREQLRKAASLLDCALRMEPAHARARFYRSLVLRGEGRVREAADELQIIARDYPLDREVQRQLGQTLYALGRITEAGAAFEAVIRLDPNDAGAYQFLAPIYASEGRKAEADRARSLYLQWRDDPLADAVAARFFATHPQWAEERIGSHVHSKDSPGRPVLTGPFASADK